MKKKKIIKRKIRTHHVFPWRHTLFIAVGFCVLLLIFAPYVRTIFFYSSSLFETSNQEVRKLPPDIKRKLEKENTTHVSPAVRVPILIYHYVEYVKDKGDKIRISLNVTPDVFANQIQTLQHAGYTCITAKDLGDVFDGKTYLPEKSIMLTFDDGHWDLDTVVLPILKKYHVRATAYIVPGFVGTNTDSLTPSQLHEVVQSGLFDVGAHTVHHISLKAAPLDQVTYEVTQSKKMLEEQYHIPVYSFAYPYGAFDQQAIRVVQHAGFTTAVSTVIGNEQSQLNRFFLYRLRPGNLTGQALLTYLEQKNFPTN